MYLSILHYSGVLPLFSLWCPMSAPLKFRGLSTEHRSSRPLAVRSQAPANWRPWLRDSEQPLEVGNIQNSLDRSEAVGECHGLTLLSRTLPGQQKHSEGCTVDVLNAPEVDVDLTAVARKLLTKRAAKLLVIVEGKSTTQPNYRCVVAVSVFCVHLRGRKNEMVPTFVRVKAESHRADRLQSTHC